MSARTARTIIAVCDYMIATERKRHRFMIDVALKLMVTVSAGLWFMLMFIAFC